MEVFVGKACAEISRLLESTRGFDDGGGDGGGLCILV